jgi:hypothetical protein
MIREMTMYLIPNAAKPPIPPAQCQAWLLKVPNRGFSRLPAPSVFYRNGRKDLNNLKPSQPDRESEIQSGRPVLFATSYVFFQRLAPHSNQSGFPFHTGG